MTGRTAETSPHTLARIAGILYLLMVPSGIFGILYVPSTLIVPGDAATTASNIMAAEFIFRGSIVSALLTQTIFIFLVLKVKLLVSKYFLITFGQIIFNALPKGGFLNE